MTAGDPHLDEGTQAEKPVTLPLDAGPGFWNALDSLVQAGQVIIDRPQGSAHPRYPALIYPLDYGYLAGTQSMDGGGIDVWVGSRPGRELDGLICTVDLLKRNSEIKLLLGCTDGERQTALDFLNGGEMMRAVLLHRGGLREWLTSRRSVRRFEPRAVERTTLERILEAATWAPSAHNRQPWRFVILDSQGARERLADAMGGDFERDLRADGLPEDELLAQVERSRRRLLEAPVVVLLCLDASLGDRYPDQARQQAELLMGVQSVALAGENLLLAAHAEGLGGVWVCAPLFAQNTVQRALNLPEDWQPQGMILLGHPARIPVPRPRRPLDEVSLYL